MNRRTFFSSAAASTGWLLSAMGCAPQATGLMNRTGGDPRSDSEMLARFSLQELRTQYHKDLFEDFLPFMDRYVIDHQVGGFLCNTGPDGINGNMEKMSWFEGRGIWVYAFLYNNLAREEHYLEAAQNSLHFVLKSKPSNPDALWSKFLTREGAPASPPDREIYGDLFIAEGLNELSKATEEKRYREMAKEILLKCVRIYDRPDYNPSIGQTYLGPHAPSFPGARILGAWMVLLRTTTQMLQLHRDADIEAIADRCVEAIVQHHFNPEFQLLNELLNHDLSRPDNEYRQLVYTGHSIELLWMLMLEAVRRNDKTLFESSVEWFRRHVEVAWDGVYGGVFRNLQNVDDNRWIMDKVLWAQEEVLIGSLMIAEQTGAQWAKELFAKTYTYVRDKYLLKQHGSPLWMYASDRKANYAAFGKMPKRVEHYHHPRHLMLNLLGLQRIIERGGNASNFFKG